jgi:hypothetical protein
VSGHSHPVEQRRTARGWYLVGLGLIGTATAIAVTGFAQMGSTVAGMQRVTMPGRADVTIAGGRSTVYFERRSVVNDDVIEAPDDLRFACTLEEQETHVAVPLVPAASRTAYDYGDYAGRSVYDFDPKLARAFTITCTGPQKFALALGGGIGAWIIVAAAGALMPGLAGVILMLVVFLRRRRQARRATA